MSSVFQKYADQPSLLPPPLAGFKLPACAETDFGIGRWPGRPLYSKGLQVWVAKKGLIKKVPNYDQGFDVLHLGISM